jgi:alkylhydroperoxidase/carboxymuconolactone decarboxylase family protein YurZ
VNWVTVPHLEETLRKLTVRDERFVAAVLSEGDANAEASGLDARTYSLVRIAALVALDASPASYQRVVSEAFAAGVSADQIVGVLIAVIETTGVPRVTSAAPKLGLALGYDVEAALELPDETSGFIGLGPGRARS